MFLLYCALLENMCHKIICSSFHLLALEEKKKIVFKVVTSIIFGGIKVNIHKA